MESVEESGDGAADDVEGPGNELGGPGPQSDAPDLPRLERTREEAVDIVRIMGDEQVLSGGRGRPLDPDSCGGRLGS